MRDAIDCVRAVPTTEDISGMQCEAIASANHEGARVPFQRGMEILGDTAQPPLAHGERMVLGAYHGLRYARNISQSGRRLTPDLIRTVHGIATLGTLNDHRDCGRFRQRDDIVVGNPATGEIIYRPPPAAAVPGMIDDLCTWFHATDGEIDPVVRAMVLHYLIAWIHPFVDGNGRTARTFFYWACTADGLDQVWALSISAAIEDDCRAYNEGFRLAQISGVITPFLTRHADLLLDAVREVE